MDRVEEYDVIVIGGGNAGFAAAVSAREHGAARVAVLEKAVSADRGGGNTFYTAGAFRVAHGGLADLRDGILADPAAESRIELPAYSREDFAGDIRRLDGRGRADERLVRRVVDESADVARWLVRSAGVRFLLSFNRQAYEVPGKDGGPGKFVFWGGLALRTEGAF